MGFALMKEHLKFIGLNHTPSSHAASNLKKIGAGKRVH